MADLALIRQDAKERRYRLASRVGLLPHQFRRLLRATVVVLIFAGLFVATGCFLDWRNNRALVAKLENPTNYQAAACDLVRLCQTDPKLIRQRSGNADPDQVRSIGKLRPDPDGLCIRSQGASVTWSNSFGQHRWCLSQLPGRGANTATHTWALSFSETEGNGDHVLMTFDMPADARFRAPDLAMGTPRPAGR